MLSKIKVIKGGMGVYVSTPFLAKAVSIAGQGEVLGTVSGVAAEQILARVLQKGDVGGHYRRALAHFPFKEMANSVLETYFVPNGIPNNQQFKAVPVWSINPSQRLIALAVCSSFSFVWLAKEGHSYPISINYLEKMQIPHIFHLVGAMLADVDCVTMGAGIPTQVPKVLDMIAAGQSPEYRLYIEGSKGSDTVVRFDTETFFGKSTAGLKRPKFLPIVASDALARVLVTKSLGKVDGIVFEGDLAGGHNAPPRGVLRLDSNNEPIYGERDKVDYQAIRSLMLPFWIGGAFASPQGIVRAKELGAQGIQVGTLFAMCEESGLLPKYKCEIRQRAYNGSLIVNTSSTASPTGFPFKVVKLLGTLSENTVYTSRERICNVQCLSVPYARFDGTIGFRCPAEDVEVYINKGGNREDTEGARCLCNGLTAAVGLGSPGELVVVTLGKDVSSVPHLMRHENDTYTAKQVVDWLLSEVS